MKIAALLRAALKDYVDLYYILKLKPLALIIEDCYQKYPGFNEMIYLKALLSFDDINMTQILFKRGWKVEIEEIKKSFKTIVKEYIKSKTH